MPVYKDPKRGTWYVSMRMPDPVTGKSKKIIKRGFSKKAEATLWENQQKAEKASGGSSATFWTIFQKYLDDNDTSKGTRQKKESWIQMYFEDYKDKPIEKISKPDLVEWRSDLKESGLAIRTMNSGLQYVRSVFAFYSTVYGGLNTGAVLKNFKMRKEDKQEMEIWDIDEFNQFLEAEPNPVYKAYFSALFWSGMRRGECAGLTADCFTGNKCHIYRSIKHAGNGFTPLKTDSSERTIVLDKGLMEMLQPLIDEADPFVFGKVHPLGMNKIRNHFLKAIERSGVKPIRLHDLRHSHASLLLNHGVNIVAVSKRLGHASINQTLSTYAHLMKNSEDQMLDTIEKLKNG